MNKRTIFDRRSIRKFKITICDSLSISAFIKTMLLQAQGLGVGTLWITHTAVFQRCLSCCKQKQKRQAIRLHLLNRRSDAYSYGNDLRPFAGAIGCHRVAGCGKGLGALIAAAAAKCFVLYIGIVQIAIPVFLELSEQQAAVSFNMFSISQLITGFVGGALAVVLFPMEWSFQIIPWH